MKTRTKALLLAMCAVLLVVTTVMATLAFLTSQTEVVKNTFTVGNVVITLDEAKVNEYGVEVEGADRVLTNEYKLMPGHTYVKDPTVHVAADSENSYIRMLVTITDLADVKAVLGVDATSGYFLPQYFVKGWDNGIWVTTGKVVEADNKATYEFRYYTTVSTVGAAAMNLEPLFTNIVVPGNINNANLALLEELEINVVAQAIQADGFDNADAAWAAFDQQTSGN